MRFLVVLLTLLPLAAVAAPAAPYALPWQLRPAIPGNVARVEDTLAFHDGGTTNVTMGLLSYKVHPSAAVFARWGFVNDFPKIGSSRGGIANPLVGAVWGFSPKPEWKIAATLMATVPVGSGGGNEPDLEGAAAVRSGVYNRSSMDNALFATNDLTVIPGVDVAYVRGGFTFQAEATLLQLTRVRGDRVQLDSSKTNFTSGLFAGYFVLPELSVGAELRYQRWLSTPRAVSLNDALRDVMTGAIGLRGHFKVRDFVLRPGVSVTGALRGVPASQNYLIAQFDLPVAF